MGAVVSAEEGLEETALAEKGPEAAGLAVAGSAVEGLVAVKGSLVVRRLLEHPACPKGCCHKDHGWSQGICKAKTLC